MSTVKSHGTITYPIIGDPKIFYLDTVYGYTTTLQRAVDMVQVQNISMFRQTRVKNYLNTLRITQFLSEGMRATGTLENVYEAISSLRVQCRN